MLRGDTAFVLTSGTGRADLRTLRLTGSAIAVAVGLLTELVDPGRPADIAALAVAVVVAVAAMWWPRLPSPVLAVALLVPVAVAVRHGQLEQSLFLASMMALVIAWFEPSTPRAVVVGVLGVLAPVAAWWLQGFAPHFGVLSWVLGISFPWVLGRLVRRQLQLTQRLAAAQRELAEQAVTEERRRIARDVHDLVGHGLAAVLLQITGARHVLRRDPDAADEALAAAETAGRRSMAELRSTMALLRSEGERGVAAPVPGLGGVEQLVDEAAGQGLRVTYRVEGDLARPEPRVALAAHRIVQEALANALRHAPAAETTVGLAVTDAVTVEVTSTGLLTPAQDGDRPRYGLVGMRERAEIVGGDVWAGAIATGWQVRARLPIGGAA